MCFTSGQNSLAMLPSRSRPMVAAPCSIPEEKVLRRSGYQTLERQAAPIALPNRHEAKRVRPPSVRVTKVSRAACPIRTKKLPLPERRYRGYSRRVESNAKANTLRMAVAPAAEATRLP